jgi:hypothetical protein
MVYNISCTVAVCWLGNACRQRLKREWSSKIVNGCTGLATVLTDSLKSLYQKQFGAVGSTRWHNWLMGIPPA